MAPMMDAVPTPKKRLIVLCDGTWCGKETDSKGNIYLLAQHFGILMDGSPTGYTLATPACDAQYFEGCGTGGTFLSYLFNGAVAADIATDCVSVYRYIVERYSLDHEIYMFGFSRGAYTVRCVAGMINNCGIIKKRSTHEETALLCEEVYKIYRRPDQEDAPGSPQMFDFRDKVSHHVRSPVNFMGLFDTVGSLGIPKFNAGIGFEYPEFYDQTVSSAVQKVYSAIAMHARMWAFQPCLCYRSKKVKSDHLMQQDETFKITQKWFPGCHYDIGRQKFKFLRVGATGLEKTLSWLPNLLSGTIEPNEVLSGLVLRWMLECIRSVDATVIPDINGKISALTKSMTSPNRKTGSGDIYAKALNYIPFGTIIGGSYWLLNSYLPSVAGSFGSTIESILGVKWLVQLLLALKDRRISNAEADMVDLSAPFQGDGRSMTGLAELQKHRYPSRTFETFQAYLLALGRIDRAEYNRRTA